MINSLTGDVQIIKEKIKSLIDKGMYGEVITILEDYYQKNIDDSIVFSFFDDLICYETAGDCGETCHEGGIGLCCCSILAFVLAGWGCSCVCSDCGWCGECSSEFSTCIYKTGANILGVCCCCK